MFENFNPTRALTKMIDTMEEQSAKSLDFVPAELQASVAGLQKAYFYNARVQTTFLEQGLESLQRLFKVK